MIFVVPSVHHTGTHFICNELLRDYQALSRMDQTQGNAYIRKHVIPAEVGWLQQFLGLFQSIVPLRHPYAVAASWKVRGHHSPNAKKQAAYDRDRMATLLKQWRILIHLIDAYKPLYLPLDVPDREIYLQRINDCISDNDGKAVSTDWKVVMSYGKRARLNSFEIEECDKLLSDPFFARFGYRRYDHVFCQDTEITGTASGSTAGAG